MLANVIRKELEQIFCQFDSKLEAADEVRHWRNAGVALPRGDLPGQLPGLEGGHLVSGLAGPHLRRPGQRRSGVG